MRLDTAVEDDDKLEAFFGGPIDYAVGDQKSGKVHGGMAGMKMPLKYVVEMFIDRMSASKNYQKENYTDRSPLEYFEHGKDHYLIHEDTEALLRYLLTMLAVRGEKETFAFVKNKVLKGKVPYEKKELDQRIKAL